MRNGSYTAPYTQILYQYHLLITHILFSILFKSFALVRVQHHLDSVCLATTFSFFSDHDYKSLTDNFVILSQF